MALGRVEVVVGERAHRGRAAPAAGWPGRTGRRTARRRRRRVTVSPSGTTVGPSTPESDGGAADADRRRHAARGQEPGPVGDRPQQVGQLGPVGRGHVERRPPPSAGCGGAGCRPGAGRGTGPAGSRPSRPGARRCRGRRPTGAEPSPAAPPRRPPRRHARPPSAPRRKRAAAGRRPAAGCWPGPRRASGGGRQPVRLAHQVLLGSVMTAIGARSCSTWPAAASICCLGGVRQLAHRRPAAVGVMLRV